MSELVNEEDFAPKTCLSKKCSALSEYIKETSLRIDLEKQIKTLKKQNASYKEAVGSLLVAIQDLLTPQYPAINFLRERLRSIPKVAQAYYFLTEDVINLWIITKEEDFEAEKKIADALVDLMSIFKNLRFDFMIIPNSDACLHETMPENSKIIVSGT
jgi:hypothetical protein